MWFSGVDMVLLNSLLLTNDSTIFRSDFLHKSHMTHKVATTPHTEKGLCL